MTYELIRKEIVAVGIEEEDIEPGRSLRAELGLDSTDIVEISLSLQRKLGVEIKIEFEGDMTVDDLCKIVESAAPTHV